jgi:uncharacterized protein (TIGR02284 family)
VELNGLIQTCKDGELGYTAAAADVRNTELETIFTSFAAQRHRFVRDLQAEVKRLGGNADDSGTTGGTLLRGWMDVKSTLTTGSGAAVLGTCETGEEVTVAAFAWVVHLDITGRTRSLVERQCKTIQEALARLLRLKAQDAAGTRFPNNNKAQ